MTNYQNDNANWDGFNTMKRWLENRNNGKKLGTYFKDYGYQKIGIYGAGDLGQLLYEELKDSDIRIAYFADRNAEGLHEINGIPVITPLGNYKEISRMLARTLPELPTMSLQEAVYEL